MGSDLLKKKRKKKKKKKKTWLCHKDQHGLKHSATSEEGENQSNTFHLGGTLRINLCSSKGGKYFLFQNY